MKKRSIEEIVAANLERLMKEQPGLSSNPKLAKLAHLGTGTISRIRNAETSASIGNIDALARAAGVRVEELVRDYEVEISPTIAQARKGAVIRSSMIDAELPRVPVVGTAQLGDDGYWLELDFPAGHGDGFITYPSRDPNAYAVRCRGDSMRPRIKPGEFVVIEPGRPYAPGDEVLVKDRRGRVMVKVFNFNRNGNIEVSSVNEDHKPITLEMTEIECVHYVSAICKPSMYYSSLS